MGVRQTCRAIAFSLVSALFWLHMLQPDENMLVSGAGGSRRSGAARLDAPSQPDGHRLSCRVAKMILVTYKSDVHPHGQGAAEEGGSVVSEGGNRVRSG